MNKVFIFIAGFFMIATLSGCVSARKQQNPQPKAEVLCEEWDKNLFASNQKNLTPRVAAEQFIEACNIGDYSKMGGEMGGLYSRRYSHYFINAKIKNIELTNANFCRVNVFLPQSSVDAYFYVKEYNIVDSDNKVLGTEWRGEIPWDIDTTIKKAQQEKSKSQSSANVGNSNTAKSGKKFGLPGKLK